MPCIFEIQTIEVTEHPIYLTLSHCFMHNFSPCKYPDRETTTHLIILSCYIASFISVFTTAHHWTLTCTTSRTPFLMNEDFNIMLPFTLRFISLEFATKILYAFVVSHVHFMPPPPTFYPPQYNHTTNTSLKV